MCYVTASPQAKPNPQVNASAFKALYTLLMKEPNVGVFSLLHSGMS